MLTISELEKFLHYTDEKNNLHIDFTKVEIKDSPPPHEPQKLPADTIAIMMFEHRGLLLLVAKAGPKSNARFQSYHYHPGSAAGNLAKSMLLDEMMAPAGFDSETVGQWMKGHLRRIDILLHKNLGGDLLETLKVKLTERYAPRYPQKRSDAQQGGEKKLMRIDILTLFPEMCETVLNESIIGRARKSQKFEVYCHNIRDYSQDKHRRVDDTPYGGGMGLVMQADPIYRAYEAIAKEASKKPLCVYLSPRGQVFHQDIAKQWVAQEDHIILICGHYEGVDQRLIDEIVDMELSIGDYVLTGGELAALVVADSVLRLCSGVLADKSTYEEESHYNVLLEHDHYTRPEEWHGRKVPQVLLSGHHKNIERYRREQALQNTCKNRSDLLQKAALTKEDKEYLKILADGEKK